MPYKAFISYSHAADGQLAPALQSALHRFAKPFYRLRAVRVFRDKTNLHLTPELWPLIQSALADSEYFLLLASPDAAKSEWVQSEIEEWLRLKNGSLDKFLIVLTGGEIFWDQAANDFDWNSTSALPTILRGKFKREPLYSDLRWAQKATDLSLRNPQFLEEIGAIGATLHGKQKDELVGQDVRQHRIFKLASAIIGLLLLALSVGASAAAYYANSQRKVAVTQTKVAVQQTQKALVSAENERAAAQKERDARDAEEQQRIKAEQAAQKEKVARENETKQRHKAEQATENEKVARIQAEERRKEAERQSKIAFSRELASNATGQLKIDPEVSTLLATEAVKVSPTEQAEQALRESVAESHLKAVLHVYKGERNISGQPCGNMDDSCVLDAEFSPDGKFVVTASGDTTPRVWETETGKLVATMNGHTGSIWHAEFSPDSRLVLTVGDFGARLWETLTGKFLRQMRHKEQPRGEESDFVMYATFSPDGHHVLTAGKDATARLWETDTGRLVSTMSGHTASLNQAAFSPDGKYVVTASNDDTAGVWDAFTGKRLQELKGHRDGVNSAAFSPDGKLVVTASTDKTAAVWDVGSGKQLSQLRGHMGVVYRAVFNPQGGYVLTCGDDGSARVWEARSGKVIADLRGHSAAVTRAEFSADGAFIVTSSGDGTARVWEASFPAKGEEEQPVETDPLMATVRQVKWRNIGVLRGHAGALLSANFSPDGNYIATASIDGTARVWEASFPQNLDQLNGPASNLKHAAFSRNGSFLVTMGENEEIKVWDPRTGRNVASLHSGEETDWPAVFSPDERFLVTRSHHTFVWNTRTWKEVARFDETWDPAFSSDNKYLVAGNDIFETSEWRKVFTFPKPEKDVRFSPDGKFAFANIQEHKTRVREAGTWRILVELPALVKSFSPDGSLFMTASQTRADTQIWSASTWQKITELSARDPVWSGDSKLVASMESGRNIQVWDARAGRRVAELSRYRDATSLGKSEKDEYHVNSLAFSADGRYLLTSSNDTSARVWDAHTGKEVLSFTGHQKPVMSASFSSDGRFAVTSSEDNTVRVWDVATGKNLTVYPGWSDWAEDAIFSPDGKFILINPEDYQAQVLACNACYSLPDLLALARWHLTRELTAEERSKFLHETTLPKR